MGKPCVAFYKYDGSNLRFEWSAKRNWHKFGSRTQLIDEGTEQYRGAIPYFMDNIAASIETIVLEEFGRGTRRIVAFAEYFGPSSFAGSHDPLEPKELMLFDVFVQDKDLLSAKDFLKLFKPHAWCAEVVYTGNMNQQFITAVREGQYALNEGVVCKGNGWSAKIKTAAYLNRLKSTFGDDWEKFA